MAIEQFGKRSLNQPIRICVRVQPTISHLERRENPANLCSQAALSVGGIMTLIGQHAFCARNAN